MQVGARAHGDRATNGFEQALVSTRTDEAETYVVECRNLPVGVTEVEVAALFEVTGFGGAGSGQGERAGSDGRLEGPWRSAGAGKYSQGTL